MSAWVDDQVAIDINEIDRKFEDNFVPKSEFQNQKKNQQLRISQAQHRILLLQKYFN